MSELKTMPLNFRVWGKKQGAFLDYGGAKVLSPWTLAELLSEYSSGYYCENLIVSQDTGIPSEDGKHMFIVDIVEQEGRRLLVGYENGEVKYYPLFNGWMTVWPPSMRIIGNIWQNPELLKEANG